MPWLLMMNDMRFPKYEMMAPAARGSSRESLTALMERETVPGYRDGGWAKSFRQGGPLEWYNAGSAEFRETGDRNDWMQIAAEGWDALVDADEVAGG